MGGPVSPLWGQTQLVRVHRGMGLWAAPQQAEGSGFSHVRKAKAWGEISPTRGLPSEDAEGLVLESRLRPNEEPVDLPGPLP